LVRGPKQAVPSRVGAGKHTGQLQGGPSVDPAPIPRIEWVFKLGLGWSGWVQVQPFARGWLARNWSNIYVFKRQEGEIRHRLDKILGFIWRGNGSDIYVARRQEGRVRHRLDKVLGFILSRQRVFLDD
jgi:hypothetical protein